jgi:hypothetical protein
LTSFLLESFLVESVEVLNLSLNYNKNAVYCWGNFSVSGGVKTLPASLERFAAAAHPEGAGLLCLIAWPLPEIKLNSAKTLITQLYRKVNRLDD